MRAKIKARLGLAAGLIKHRRKLKEVVSSHLFFLENPDDFHWGSISEVDQEAVAGLVERATLLSGPIVEIGTLFGLTTQLIASLKRAEKELITVDNFSWNPFHMSPEDHRAFTRRALHYVTRHCKTRIFDGTSEAFFDTYTGEVPSLIFIDADHSYAAVSQDIRRARELGILVISGHDYSPLFPGVQRAVDEAFGPRISVKGTVWSWEDPGHEGSSSKRS